MQRERKIVIKPCDKGAGIIVVDFKDYVSSCKDHLSSSQIVNGNECPFYSLSSGQELKKSKEKILSVLYDGKSKNFISAEEFIAMDPSNSDPAKFYQIFKVHKSHPNPGPGSLPPGRPIVSGCNSHTQNISKFVDAHIKEFVPMIPSYIQDTPDFLRKLEHLKSNFSLQDAFLVTIDVSSLYTNIPQDEGLVVLENFLDTVRTNKTVPTHFLVSLTKLILSENIFEFDKQLYRQNIGTAMGTPVAPSYANIFMSMIDTMLNSLATYLNHGTNPFISYYRYIDDIFIVYKGPMNVLQLFLEEINNIHDSIKFTSDMSSPFSCNVPHDANYDCFCHTSNSIPFLDTLVTLNNGHLVTDLFRKPTDRCQYLLPSSCHPSNITKNIPYSLAFRIVRICSERSSLLMRLDELKELLLTREYCPKVIDEALNRAKLLSREETLKKVVKKRTDRVVFSLPYHPALPSINGIVKNAWKTMVKDPYLKEIFDKPPMVAFRRPKSLRDMLVRAKLPENNPRKSVRNKNGMKKCQKCVICPFVNECKSVQSTYGLHSTTINEPTNCNSTNVIYVITCIKCHEQYIGQTGRPFKERLKEHLSYVRNKKTSEPTGFHFNQPGHKISHLRATILEICNSNSKIYRETREELFIQNFQTKFHGMNRKL